MCDELGISPLRAWRWFFSSWSKGQLDPVDVVSYDCVLPSQVRASDVPMSESTTKITKEFGLFVFDICCYQFVVGKEFGGHREHRLCDVLEDVFFGFLSVVYDVPSSPDRGWLADSK